MTDASATIIAACITGLATFIGILIGRERSTSGEQAPSRTSQVMYAFLGLALGARPGFGHCSESSTPFIALRSDAELSFPSLPFFAGLSPPF